MKALTLILGSILLALVSGNAFTALLSEPKVDLESTVANFDETIYTDLDLHKLILNNLGLLSNHKLTHSNEKIINKYGESVLTNKILLNYLLLIDADSELLATQPISEEKKIVKLDACAGDDLDTCILSLIYDSEREDSVVSEFELTHSKKAHVANHFYSSNPSATEVFKDVSFSLTYDAYGNVVIVENRSGRKFPVQKNLTKCVNEAAKGEVQFDLENGIISTKNSASGVYEKAVTFQGEQKGALRSFAEEICTLVSMPKFLRKDSTPTLFTFYMSTLRKLQRTVSPKEREVLHRVLTTAYKQFQDILKVRFGEKQVSGQVVLTNGTKSVEAQVQQKLSNKKSEVPTHQIRMLQDTTTTTTTTASTLTSTQVLFRVFGVAFVIVLAVILASLAGIQVEKDTLVYSKFLTVDQRK